MKNRTRLITATLLILGILAGCGRGTAPAETELRQITLSMGYVPNVQFTPVYVAVDKGYFAEEGLEITFDYGMENDLLKLVGTGERQFVIGSGDQIILARSQGLPVVYVLNWYRRFPVGVASLEPLAGLQDLVGKNVGIPGPYGASYIGWQAMLDASGIDSQEVSLISIGYTQVESLVTKQVDAAVIYAMNEPVQLAQKGHQVSVLYVSDYIDFVSNGLITNEETIAKEPELVRSMVRAVLRGLQDTLDDPDGAFDTCREFVPEIDDESAPLQRAVLEECLLFWRGDDLGRSSHQAWESSAAFMQQIGMVEGEVDVAALYSNAFIPDLTD